MRAIIFWSNAINLFIIPINRLNMAIVFSKYEFLIYISLCQYILFASLFVSKWYELYFCHIYNGFIYCYNMPRILVQHAPHTGHVVTKIRATLTSSITKTPDEGSCFISLIVGKDFWLCDYKVWRSYSKRC